MELSKREKRKLKQEGKTEETVQPSTELKIHHEHKKPVSKFKIVAIFLLAIVIIITSYSVYSFSRQGPYDNFAKCLTEKGAVMYGAMDWCKFTQGQKGMFGKSFKYINYHEHTELPDIKKTPTWVINGKWYENAQSFDILAQATGCSING